MLWYVVSSIAMALGFFLVYIYYLRKGQFEDPEDVKYQMFREEENEQLLKERVSSIKDERKY